MDNVQTASMIHSGFGFTYFSQSYYFSFGYFTFPNLFGFITENTQVVYNCDANKSVLSQGSESQKNTERGKALLQKLYDDIASR